MTNAKFTVSEEMKTGPGHALFDFFAECVANFCKQQNIDALNGAAPVPMGFTFSFPVHQTGIAGGASNS
jgi:hexokinase